MPAVGSVHFPVSTSISDPTSPIADASLVQLHERPLGHVVVILLARQPRQHPVLQQQRPNLRRIALRSAHRARAQIHILVRHPRRRIEHGRHAPPQIIGQFQQPLVARHLVAGDQTPQQPNRDLEILDVDILVEIQLRIDQRARLIGLGL